MTFQLFGKNLRTCTYFFVSYTSDVRTWHRLMTCQVCQIEDSAAEDAADEYVWYV
eukprot:GSA25T00007257001.1